MSQNPEMPLPVNSTPSLTTCSNCHSPMPSELRFCRNCGFRLGHGTLESETLYFGGERGAVVPGAGSLPARTKKRRKMSGMTWVFVGLLIFFIGAAAFTAVISPIREHVSNVQSTPRSYAGVKEWQTTQNRDGVTFNAASPPGGPADKAGLVGGDVIISFDGKRIQNEDEMSRVMTETPVGKTVDVEYLRDGKKYATKLTTVSNDELRRLEREFSRNRQNWGVFGYDDDDSKRVQIPGTDIVGVQLNEILNSRPADMAGVKEGDIVLEFDGIPIRTPDEFLMRIRRAAPYSTVKVVVMRGEEKLEIPVKMGRQ